MAKIVEILIVLPASKQYTGRPLLCCSDSPPSHICHSCLHAHMGTRLAISLATLIAHAPIIDRAEWIGGPVTMGD